MLFHANFPPQEILQHQFLRLHFYILFILSLITVIVIVFICRGKRKFRVLGNIVPHAEVAGSTANANAVAREKADAAFKASPACLPG